MKGEALKQSADKMLTLLVKKRNGTLTPIKSTREEKTDITKHMAVHAAVTRYIM